MHPDPYNYRVACLTLVFRPYPFNGKVCFYSNVNSKTKDIGYYFKTRRTKGQGNEIFVVHRRHELMIR